MLELQLLELFALGMEVDSANFALELVEANVVEALKAGTCYGAHPVVGHEEVLLPAHEDVLPLRNVPDVDGTLARLLFQRAEGRKLLPVVEVNAVCGAPSIVIRDEVVLCADDLALKVRRQRRVVLGQALNAQVSAEEGLLKIHVLDLNLDIIYLALRLLRAMELAACPQERRGRRRDHPQTGKV